MSGSWDWLLGRLLQVVVIWQNLGQEVNLQSLRSRPVSSLPPVTAAPIHHTVLSQGLLGGESAPSSHYAPVGQVGLSSYIALGLYDVAVANLEAVTHTPNLTTKTINIVAVLGTFSF